MPPNVHHYFYSAFGLSVRSDLNIPELLAADTRKPDLIISNVSSSASAHFLQRFSLDTHFARTGNYIFLRIPTVAQFWISPKRIFIDSVENIPESTIRLFLLGTVMGVVLFLRGTLPLHASSIASPYGALLFAGRSGSGKSTLAMSLCQRGCRLISDDISPLSLTNSGEIVVSPTYPQVKLCSDILASIDDTNLQNSIASPLTGKHLLPLKNAPVVKPCPINKIFLLSPGHNNISINKLSGTEKWTNLAQHIYRPQFVQLLQLTEFSFNLLSAIVASVDIYEIRRPDDKKSYIDISSAIFELFDH